MDERDWDDKSNHSVVRAVGDGEEEKEGVKESDHIPPAQLLA